MQQSKPVFSLEFFPPKTPEGREKLAVTRNKLAQLEPAYISVTFGAGGSTQSGTLTTIKDIKQANLDAAPHLSCISSSKEQLKEILQTYMNVGINRVVALRGDMPSGTHTLGELRYANELVEFIREETGDHFSIEVAAYPEVHPQAACAREDLANFKRKMDAGANSAITQYFYNPQAYFRFVDDCEKMGIHAPIIPGIMPITNYTQLARFSDMCGAEIPRWIRKRLQDYSDDIASLKAFGYEVTLELCQTLLSQKVPGLHFYTMNQSQPTTKLWKDLNL